MEENLRNKTNVLDYQALKLFTLIHKLKLKCHNIPRSIWREEKRKQHKEMPS